ncbi:MAG: ATP synthase F1 subunit delta [Flavobacteriales bacterium]|jgi:F-type H+-transporting ATPase subunit delta|nr:ATP synthase F1 subunit delta [Flavobacteriales bacterium]
MKGTRAALRYAKAVLSLAKDKNLAEAVNADLLLIASTLESNKNLRDTLLNPVIKSGVKQSILTKIFEGKINGITQGLLHLLIENKRLNLLLPIAKEYAIIFDFDMGMEIANVTTATPLTKDLESKILEKIKTLTDNEVTIKNIVDSNIIGGFILRIGDKQYDASITGQLNLLKREFEDNYYVSKF